MAIVIFRIRGIGETAGIKIRFKHGNFDYEFSTRIKVNRRVWSNKQQRVKNMIEAPYKEKLNKKLNDLRAHVLNAYYDASITNTPLTKLWLSQTVSEFLKEPLNKDDESKFFLVNFIEEFIEEAKKPYNPNSRIPISESTISTYNTTLRRLKGFESKHGLKLKISDINLSFHKKFHQYLSEDLMLNPNTIGGYFSRIKLFCNNAEIQGLKINKEFKSKNFYSPQNETNDIYLNEEEIKNIFNHKFDSKRLDNARDWLIIACNTGLRISDLLTLTKENIKGNNIHKKTFKTKTNVVIPILRMVQSTIDKYENNFPKPISDQKLNLYIKEVCREVGLTELTLGAKKVAIEVNGEKIYRKLYGEYPKYELISSHIGRRSFATNSLGKVNTLTIMKITGHKSSKIFESYIKKSGIEFAEEFRRSFEE